MARRTIIDTKTNFISEFATEDDKFVYHTQQNVAPVLDHVKKIKELSNKKFNANNSKFFEKKSL